MNRKLAPHFALRSDDGIEVGTLGDDIVVRRGGWLARMLRESCPPWLQEVLLVAERRLAPAGLGGSVGRIPRQAFPRELTMSADDRTLVLANYRPATASGPPRRCPA